MSRRHLKNYPGDMTKEQEELLLPLVQEAKQGGGPRTVDIVSVINAIFYVLCTRCAWRSLPHDYPPYGTVYDIFADGGFSGIDFMRSIMDTFGWIIETVLRYQKAEGFQVLPKRWLVERTFGWFNYGRRLSKDYEVLPETSEAFIYIGKIRHDSTDAPTTCIET